MTTLPAMEQLSILRYAHRDAATGLTIVPQQVICSQAD